MFEPTPPVEELQRRLTAFMEAHVYPAEGEIGAFFERTGDRQAVPPLVEELKAQARAEGLWNLWIPDPKYGPGLSNLEYAPLCETMGRSLIAPELFNCSFPDTGNMEVLALFGTPEQKERWLVPLLEGEIRSAFAMTEPDVASSDPTNVRTTIRREGDDYVIDGHKWYITGAGDPRCRVVLVFGRSSEDGPRHGRHSIVLVPMEAPGVEVGRPMQVLGFDDPPAGHVELTFRGVRVGAENMVLGEGRGFEIAQARLGPGRIHHCMRAIGIAERALELMVDRALSREAFGRRLADMGVVRQAIADSRMAIDQARLLTLATADTVDRLGGKGARSRLAQLKVVVPNMGMRVLDRAIQVHGAAGLSQDLPLAAMYASMRALRLGDGPDEVHRETVARHELRKRERGPDERE
jgi:acyl-CoA dehydrogenase